MAEPEKPNDPSRPQGARGDAPSSGRSERPRQRALTPEQRRFLGIPRTLHERQELEAKAAEAEAEEETAETAVAPPVEEEVPEPPQIASSETPAAEESEEVQGEEPEEGDTEEPEELPPVREPQRVRVAAGTIRPSEEPSRKIEIQHAVLIIGGLLLVGLTFYIGKKFDYWKYLYQTRVSSGLPEGVPAKFSDVSSEDLVEQALLDERAGKWREAAERLITAKHKNLAYRGILFRVGKIAYDHKDYDTADKLFERAIAFRENTDAANYFRGLIAIYHHDLSAAERFFTAAAKEAPFSASHYYYWGEVLRLDLHPHEAIARYEQAARRAESDQDKTICEFKIRMARLEAAQSPEVNAEIEKKRSAGPLSVDWLMTAAALKIREGHIEEAGQLMAQARDGNQQGVFATCLNDAAFVDACQKNKDLAEVCRMDPAIQALFP